jgi:hypothetical protein
MTTEYCKNKVASIEIQGNKILFQVTVFLVFNTTTLLNLRKTLYAMQHF